MEFSGSQPTATTVPAWALIVTEPGKIVLGPSCTTARSSHGPLWTYICYRHKELQHQRSPALREPPWLTSCCERLTLHTVQVCNSLLGG